MPRDFVHRLLGSAPLGERFYNGRHLRRFCRGSIPASHSPAFSDRRFPPRDPGRRGLAPLAGADPRRGQCRDRTSGGVGHGERDRLEDPDARLERGHAHHFGGHDLPERVHPRRCGGGAGEPLRGLPPPARRRVRPRQRRLLGAHRTLGARSRRRIGALDTASERPRHPRPEAEHVLAVSSHRRESRVCADRDRDAQGLRFRGERTLVARHSGGLRRFRTELGLREQPAPLRGRDLRPGPARHEDGRSLLHPADRQGRRRDGLARRAPHRRHTRVPRFVHHPVHAPGGRTR